MLISLCFIKSSFEDTIAEYIQVLHSLILIDPLLNHYQFMMILSSLYVTGSAKALHVHVQILTYPTLLRVT